MSVNITAYQQIIQLLHNKATLVAVSKTKPIEDIETLYQLGQRSFGENYVQELVEKYTQLPKDIQWHFIGHLQSNKVKYIAPFVYLIHGVDSIKLLLEVNKQAIKQNRTINCLLQVHIATEETKFGFDEIEILAINWAEINALTNVKVVGLMGMASFTNDIKIIESEFKQLQRIYQKLQQQNSSIQLLSMGMSADYTIALQYGSNMVRIGSTLFGNRVYAK